MKSSFKKAVLSGLLATAVLSGNAFAEVSAYNGTAIRKPGERRVAEAAFVAEKCWRPLTNEGAEHYPQAVEAISTRASKTVLGQELLAQVKKEDIAFCPPSSGLSQAPVMFASDMKIISVAENMDKALEAAFLRHAAAQGVLMLDKKNALLETASTEKKIRAQLYMAAAAATREIVMALEEKELGLPSAWDRVGATYGMMQGQVFDRYSDVKKAGGTHKEALVAAAASAFTALFADEVWLNVQITDVLKRTAGEVDAGLLQNRPIDSDDERQEGLLKRAGRLTDKMNFAARMEVPSREAIFKDNSDLLWKMQWIDALRNASGYGIDSSRVNGVLNDMQATNNPYLKEILKPN